MPALPVELAHTRDFLSGMTVRDGSRPTQWDGLRDTDWNLVFTLTGELEVRSGKEILIFPRGALILIAPGYPRVFHCLRARLLWFHFLLRPGVEPAIVWPEPSPGFRQVVLQDREFRNAARILYEVAQLDRRRANGWYEHAACLLESVFARGNMAVAEARRPGDRRIRLAQRILEDYSRPVDMDAVARQVGMSRAAFYTLFRKEAGLSPRRYRERLQLRRARELLVGTNADLAEIAWHVGMKNLYYFSTRFKLAFGMPPGRYRSRCAAPAPENGS